MMNILSHFATSRSCGMGIVAQGAVKGTEWHRHKVGSQGFLHAKGVAFHEP